MDSHRIPVFICILAARPASPDFLIQKNIDRVFFFNLLILTEDLEWMKLQSKALAALGIS